MLWQKSAFVPQARISGPRSEVLSTYSILHIHTSLKLALLSPSLLRGAFLKMIIMIIVIMIITHPVFQYSIYMHICFHPSNGKELLFPCTSQQNWNNIRVKTLIPSWIKSNPSFIYKVSFKNITRIVNAVQVTLWLSITNPQSHDSSFPICQY